MIDCIHSDSSVSLKNFCVNHQHLRLYGHRRKHRESIPELDGDSRISYKSNKIRDAYVQRKAKKSALCFDHSEIQRADSFFNQLKLISSNELKRRDRKKY